MRVGIIYQIDYHPAARGIAQLSLNLKELGCQPTIVARQPKECKKVLESEGIKVYHVPVCENGKGVLHRERSIPLPLNPLWTKWLVEIGTKEQWDAIILRDTLLAWPVQWAGKKLSIPVYADIRENLAAYYSIKRSGNLLLRSIKSPKLVRMYERLTLKKFQNIFAVSKELAEWLVSEYKLDKKKVFLLENTPHDKFLRLAEKELETTREDDGKLRIIYAGSVNKHKGVLNTIKAMPYILEKVPEAHLCIIGKGDVLDYSKKLTKDMGIEDKIEWYPPLPVEEYIKVLRNGVLGIESCFLNELTQQTVPGKLFEYMALGLPVVSSPRNPMIRILEEVGCGKIIHSFDPEVIGREIGLLLKDGELLAEMGKKGRKAVLERYNYKHNREALRKGLGLAG